ncbi:MAG: nucleoside triphosphate pyrophosphohydrolase [Clostridiales bacterium 43-6]|nr:MAG: nucleoside triphosphate pyrophosphohydrolase [Clostridiales bacterium 43-6]
MYKNFPIKSKYDLNDLLKIMEILRGPEGCPWDREQNHKTIKANFLEEVYETMEAIENDDTEGLKEELGDVLLQIVFHSQMSDEAGEFDFYDVADGICKKLILRHPHVFGNTIAETADVVLNNWDSIKKEEKGYQSITDTLKSVPTTFPGLMKAAKVGKRAAKAGFDWPDVTGAVDKIYEETKELEQIIGSGTKEELTDELGDILFSVVNVSRYLDIDPEEAILLSTGKFIKRFEIVEKLASKKKLEMKQASIEELTVLWEEAKKRL